MGEGDRSTMTEKGQESKDGALDMGRSISFLSFKCTNYSQLKLAVLKVTNSTRPEIVDILNPIIDFVPPFFVTLMAS